MSPPTPWFVAAYWGACADCGDDIEPGSVACTDGEDRILCPCCGQRRQEEEGDVADPVVTPRHFELVFWGPDTESVFPGGSGGDFDDEGEGDSGD